MSQVVASTWMQEREAQAPEREFIPGASRRGELVGADWRFLLPNRCSGRVLLWGVPRPAVLAVVARQSHTLLVTSPDRKRLHALQRAAQEDDLQNARMLHVNTLQEIPDAEQGFDLVVLLAGKSSLPSPRPHALATAARRLLRPGGLLLFETGGFAEMLRYRSWTERLAPRDLRVVRRFWLFRHQGEIRLALPLDDVGQMARYFCNHVLYGRSRSGRLFFRFARACARLGVLHYVLPRRGVLLQRSQAETKAGAGVSYLDAQLARAGLDPERLTPAFFAHGLYDANKVALFLFDRAKPTPKIIVKITRAPDYNGRLEREYRSLTLLEQGGFAEPGTYPRPLFFGDHGGLALLGQSVVHGAPFRARSTGTPTCPCVLAALDWLIRLGKDSADASAATAQEVATWLRQLYARFVRIVPLTPDEEAFLSEQIAVLAHLDSAFPLVFRHGDAGTWNVLIATDGHPVFLDWEISEPRGVPLWDVLEFLRSSGSWAARARGVRNSQETYARMYLEASAFSAFQADAVTRYCDVAGVPREAVAPLFYTCWLYRALQEARRTRGAPEAGPYLGLLRLCIRQRNAPGLQWVFA